MLVARVGSRQVLRGAVALMGWAVAGAGAVGQVYLDRQGVEAALREAVGAGSGRIERVEIGRPGAGGVIAGLRVALPGEVPAPDRPRLLVVAGLQADHRVGTAVAARVGQALLALAEADAGVKAALGRTCVEIVPLMNPDGLDHLLLGPTREFRTTPRPNDLDRDGLQDEDGPKDLDGDGVVASLRVPDPLGAWRVADEDPRLLVKADATKGERGTFRLEPEGLDQDGDGAVAEDGPGGIDLDRNFAHGWKEHDPEAGSSAPSEPETRALIEHCLRNRVIAAIVVYGRRDNVVKTPETNKSAEDLPPNGPLGDDRGWLESVGKAWRAITGAKEGEDDPADGGFHQWAYAQYGVPAFATRVFHRKDPDDLPVLPSGKKPESDEAKWLSWSDRALDGKGFLPWKALEHPTLGAVEVGGWRPMARVNPPESELPRLVEEQARCLADLLGRLPRLAFAEWKVERKGGEVAEVRATLLNEGFLPAVTAMGRKARAVMPVRVTVEAPPGTLLQGERQVRVDELRGLAGRELRWLLRAAPGTTVLLRAVSEKAGSAQVEIRL